ncbi:delta(3,5)-Delta(2,4)-dienoyl-CoA isomerase, peroxisomal-like [Phragmites australis]|uniref:delta(3,5)-Delta(2,4)-dienoyl-CoA isomerase, peroxisomal-like n=1 Tax=Phragmites australis TaxID=29695 RepID=UPI002D77FC44|nr:delta(3,5)-Delta(2,4)-dienoyl-CoA isomerase, peroxisomal-like [Phragmites australis]
MAGADAELRRGFDTLAVTQPDPSAAVYEVRLNRPAQRNALSPAAFAEIPRAMALLDRLPSARAVVLSAAGPHFCAGIELGGPGNPLTTASAGADPAAAAEGLRRKILEMQAALTALEQCRKPVIAAVHGACVGGGVDIVAACDIRYCSRDATFVVKEVDMAIVADLGALQRLPRIIGYGNAAELALTGRKITAMEAKEMGLVSKVFNSKQELDAGVAKIAREIAEKSAWAVMGTKAVLLRSRDVTVEQGLEHVATWNAAMLRSNDLKEAIKAFLEKRKPVFSKL